MFGKGKGEEEKMQEEEKKKKEEEKKKMEEEMKKKEEEKKKQEEAQPPAETAPPEPAAGPESHGGGLEGLKNISESPANAEEKPPEETVPKTPPEPSPEETATEEKPKKKARKESASETEKLRKQIETQKESLRALEKEKEDAMKKGDELASLIEDISSEMKEAKAAPAAQAAQPAPQMPDITPKLKEIEEKTTSQISALQAAIAEMGKKKDDEKKDEEDVTATMKKMFDKRLKELSDKLEEASAKPAPGTGQGQGGEVSGGLSAIGGGVEFKKEVDSLKKSLKDMATLLDAFKEEAENRFMAIDREMQVVERFPEMEQKMDQFEKKLGPENVQRLRLLISSADDLKDEVIPLVVKRVVEDKVEPHSRKVKEVQDENRKNREKMLEISAELKADRKDIEKLYKLDDRISKLEELTSGFTKLIAEVRTTMKDLDKNQRIELSEKMKEMLPKMIETESSNVRKEFAARFAFMEEALKSAENVASEAHKDIAALSAIKGEMDMLDDKMNSLDEEKEKLEMKIEGLRSKDKDIEDRLDDMQTPKEIITELDNKTKDILDIREFFVRRANQLEERINQLDERAVPTKKLHEKVDSIFANLSELRENYKKLDERVTAENKQFQTLIKEHSEQKAKLEDKLKEQKTRISVLLKEFK